ncbi:hypothetical protein BKI52_18705 [marine bacterium AO1-C]|nr:hypothetical protein BKI52_18705 [marine bacterium AO1-C]
MNTSQQNKQANKSFRKLVVPFLLILSVLANLALVYVIFEKKDVEIARQKKVNAEQKANYSQSLSRLSIRLKQEITNSKKFGQQQQKYRDSLTKVLKNVETDRANLKRVMVLTQTQMNAYKLKIAAYEELLIRKDSLMLGLKEINTMLGDKNRRLNIRINQTIEDKANVEQKNAQLESKIKQAAGLKVKDIVFKRVNRRGKAKTGKVFRERNISQLQVYLSFIDNELIEIGNKSVIMLLKDEMGQTLIPSSGSGTFDLAGQETSYTMAQNFLYDKSAQTIMFNYDKDKPLGKGKFFVELYSEGKRIGTDSFRVR